MEEPSIAGAARLMSSRLSEEEWRALQRQQQPTRHWTDAFQRPRSKAGTDRISFPPVREKGALAETEVRPVSGVATAPAGSPEEPLGILERPPVPIDAASGLYSFRAEDTEIQQALALFARSNHLNIVPDPDVTGRITVDLQNLPLEAIMEALLSALGYYWDVKDGLIRVHTKETRIFTINYPRMVRRGDGYSSASLSGASAGAASGGAGAGASGGGGGGGGGAGGGRAGGGLGGAGGASGAMTGSGTSITQQDSIDFWKELESQLSLMLSENGKVILDKMSGIVQVTDRHDVVELVSQYLELMQQRTHRQVDIEARIYEVTLNKDYELGVDWRMVLKHPKVTGSLAATSLLSLAGGGFVAKSPVMSATPLLKQSVFDLSAVLEALQEQGRVTAISQPRLRSLNNQMAVIRVGTEQPFFNTQSGFIAGTGGSPGGTFENTSFNTITVGTILSVTPQISEDEHVTLDISPVISNLVSIQSSGQTTAPVLDIKQSSSLVRVRSGDTIVIGGLIQDKSSDSTRRVPLIGDIPVLGVPLRGSYKVSRKSELVIFLTPTILDSNCDGPGEFLENEPFAELGVPVCPEPPPFPVVQAAGEEPAVSLPRTRGQARRNRFGANR